MKKFLVGVFATLLIVAGITAITEPKANAGWPGGTVINESGWSVTVQMNGGRRYTEWEGENSHLWGRDADEFRVNRDWRCLRTDIGDFKVKPGHFFKISNFDTIDVAAYTYKRCGKDRWVSSRYTRIG